MYDTYWQDPTLPGWQTGDSGKAARGSTVSYPTNQTCGLFHQLQRPFTEAFGFRCLGTPHQFKQDRLLRM